MVLMNKITLTTCFAAFLVCSALSADEAAEKLIGATYKLSNESSTASSIAVHRTDNGKLQRMIVTANHVLEQMKGNTCMLVSRLRGDKGIFRRHEIPVAIRDNGKRLWRADPQHDVAVLPLPDEVSVVTLPYECLATEEMMADVYTGDEIIAAVFPERIEANNAGFPILRGGTIASHPLRPVESHATFLIDATTWKGDSGGAVAHRTLRYDDQWPLVLGITRGMQNITDTVNESRFVIRQSNYPLGIGVIGQAVFARRLIEN